MFPVNPPRLKDVLIVSAHPYCASKFTFTSSIERALSAKMNNDRAAGHCYSFCLDLTILAVQ